MNKFGTLDGVLAADCDALCKIPGIKFHTAALLKLVEHLRKCRPGVRAPETVRDDIVQPEAMHSRGATDACRALARPVQDTLYFGGETTDLKYQFSTVRGAIRAASSLEARSNAYSFLRGEF